MTLPISLNEAIEVGYCLHGLRHLLKLEFQKYLDL